MFILDLELNISFTLIMVLQNFTLTLNWELFVYHRWAIDLKSEKIKDLPVLEVISNFSDAKKNTSLPISRMVFKSVITETRD